MEKITLSTLSTEELTNLIKDAQSELEVRKNEEKGRLISNLAYAAEELRRAYPFVELKTEVWCEECECMIDVSIDLANLTCEDAFRE